MAETTTSSTGKKALLWGVFLTPALAWLAVLVLAYLVQDIGCAWFDTGKTQAYPAWIAPVVIGLSVVLACLIVVAGFIGLWLWRDSRRRTGMPNRGVSEFIGMTGAVMAALFLIGIGLLVINPIVLRSC